MSTTAPTADQLNVGDAFGYVFRSKNWFGKLAVGALCVLFFWLLLIPVFILIGYFLEAARTISQGARELPPWSDIGKKLSQGFILFVVIFVWGLPGSILNGGARFDSTGYHPGSLAGLGGLYDLLLGLITPAIWSQFMDGGFAAGFDFRTIFRRAGAQPGLTVLVWLMTIVAGIIGFLGIILVFVGVLFTIPYAGAVSAHLYGQFKRLTQSVATAT